MQGRMMRRERSSGLTRGSSVSTVSSLSPNEGARGMARLSSGTLAGVHASRGAAGSRATASGAGVGGGGVGGSTRGRADRCKLGAPLRAFLKAEFARVQQGGGVSSSRDATLTGASANAAFGAGRGGFKPDLHVGGIVHEADDEGENDTATPTPRDPASPGTDSGGDDAVVSSARQPAADTSPSPAASPGAGSGASGAASAVAGDAGRQQAMHGGEGGDAAPDDGQGPVQTRPQVVTSTTARPSLAGHIVTTPRMSLSPTTTVTPTPTGSASASPSDGTHRDYLRCEEVCKLAPPQDMPVRFSHVAVLYAIDSNHDGRFSMQELEAFLEVCVDIRTRCKPHEFETLLQGRCVTMLVQQTRSEAGVTHVVDWLMRMLADSYPPVQAGPRGAACLCVAIDAVFVAYSVLCGGTLSALDFTPSQLLDLLHLAAEEQGLLDLDDGDLDDLVPVQVLRSFVHHFVRSVAEVYRPMGLAMPGLTRGSSLHTR